MNKSMIFKAMAIVIALTACTALAACSDDNDDPDVPEQKSYKSIIADYSLTVSDDYLAIYDLVADYSFDDEHHSESINTTTWTVNKTFTSNQPKHFTCVVTATPKANLPEYAADTKITLWQKHSLNVNGVYANGITSILKSVSNENTASFSGDDLAKIVSRGPRTLFSLDYTRK